MHPSILMLFMYLMNLNIQILHPILVLILTKLYAVEFYLSNYVQQKDISPLSATLKFQTSQTT